MSERYVIDTQCWLWAQSAPDRLSKAAAAAIADTRNEIFFSAAVGWEIAIKHALGKLTLPSSPERYVTSRVRSGLLTVLPIQLEHTLRVAKLPQHHRDPFDRILVAQAQVEKLKLITADAQLRVYDVRVLWAG